MTPQDIMARIENTSEADLLDDMALRADINGLSLESLAWCDAQVAIYNHENAFGIMGKVRQWLRIVGREAEIEAYLESATAADYETLKQVSRELMKAQGKND